MRAITTLFVTTTAAILAAACSSGDISVEEEEDPIAQVDLPLNIGGLCGGERCDAVARGAIAFFDRKLHGMDGNGRSCGDCHMVTDHFQLSPANAEARYQRWQWAKRFNRRADDPLFRPVDADDFRVNGDNASDYRNLRENGLIRVTFQLPPNVKLIDPATNLPSSETFVDVWRSVPSVNDVKLTGAEAGGIAWPRGVNPVGGYQQDARFATLQEQALGALTGHAEIQNAPAQRMLDDLAAFQRVLFSSHRVRALSEAVDRGAANLPDADPPLSAFEQQGKATFVRACGQCHGTPGQSNPGAAGIFRYGGVQAQCPRPVDAANPPRWNFKPCPPQLARNVRTYEVTSPTGVAIRRPSSDPGRTLLTGFAGGPPPLDDWNARDVPTTRNVRNTAPYFHNNSAATLEEMLDHYSEFYKFVAATAPPAPAPRPPPVSTDGVHIDRPFTPEERPALLAYLRKL